MNKNQIISEMYNNKDINQAIGKMHPVELQDDLKQEIFLVLCEMADDRLISMWQNGFLKYFIVRTMLNMAKSDRSTFYNLFRKTFIEYVETYDQKDDLHDPSEMDIKLGKSMEVLHWYEKEIFRLYSDNGKNILKLSRETKIPYRSLFKTIRKVKILLKFKIRNHEIL
jgi:3'-phosphoadenosine 5'-phosphosulfate sulfotransferase (PAPS reductase)/FAD synthetase